MRSPGMMVSSIEEVGTWALTMTTSPMKRASATATANTLTQLTTSRMTAFFFSATSRMACSSCSSGSMTPLPFPLAFFCIVTNIAQFTPAEKGGQALFLLYKMEYVDII